MVTTRTARGKVLLPPVVALHWLQPGAIGVDIHRLNGTARTSDTAALREAQSPGNPAVEILALASKLL